MVLKTLNARQKLRGYTSRDKRMVLVLKRRSLAFNLSFFSHFPV